MYTNILYGESQTGCIQTTGLILQPLVTGPPANLPLSVGHSTGAG